MKTPIQTPIERHDFCFYDDEGQKITSDVQLDYIAKCVNNHERLKELVQELVDYAANSTLEDDPLPPCVEEINKFLEGLQ